MNFLAFFQKRMIFLLAIVCSLLIILPTLSFALPKDVSNQQLNDNCKTILVRESSRWDWKLNEEATNSFLIGEKLPLTISPFIAQPSSPQGNSTSPQSPAPQPSQPNGTQNVLPLKGEENKANLKASSVEVCASLKTKEDEKSLTLKVNDGLQAPQFEIYLDGQFPVGAFRIRSPAEIILTSSDETMLPRGSRKILISSKWVTTLVSSLFLASIYYCLAKAVDKFYRPSRERINRGWKIFDPAVISASDYGSASLANFQILWFSLIVAWILAFSWLVMGRLLNPSAELLSLLGISGASNVLAKSLSSNKQRLSLDSWNWLIEQGYLKRESDIDPINVAKWGDFVIDGGVLDPSRYQLIIFGFLVGINLLFGNVLNLETFKIPVFFLSLQAISSGLYLFGKSVNPNTKDELEAKIIEFKNKYSNPNDQIQDNDKNFLMRSIESLYGYAAIGNKLKASNSLS
jgi:hypothetical protein